MLKWGLPGRGSNLLKSDQPLTPRTPGCSYKVKLSNMKFGGSDPYFGPEFNLLQLRRQILHGECPIPSSTPHYTDDSLRFPQLQIAICGLCGMPLKKWVDAQIELSKPQFDQEMADEDAEIDAAQDLPPTVFAAPVVKVQNQTDVPLTELTATYATDVP